MKGAEHYTVTTPDAEGEAAGKETAMRSKADATGVRE